MSDVIEDFNPDEEMASQGIGSEDVAEGFMEPEVAEVFSSEEHKQKVLRYVLDECAAIAAGDEFQKMKDLWRKWRRQREARPEVETKSYPWANASNVCVPLAMTNGNGIFALLKASIGARKPMFSVSTLYGQRHEQAKVLQKLLDVLVTSPHHVNLAERNDAILYDLATLGTQIVKIPWVVDRWQFKRPSEAGGMEDVVITRKDSPDVIPIPLEDFICRPFYDDIQRAPLVGHRITLFEHELKQREALGIYQNVDQVLEGGELTDLDEEKLESLERMGITPDTGRDMKMYNVLEVYLFEDVDQDGVPEDIILWIEPVTETLLRAEFNDLGIRPYVDFQYLKRPGMLYGIGTGWMVEHMQDEIDTLHNMRIDGTHLSMLQMYVSRRGSGVASGESFRPLKNIQVDNPREDFMPIKFPDVGYTTIQAELMSKEYADRATGASDAMMGFENRAISTRATASGTMFLAQQGSKMFKSLEESVEHAYGEVARILIYQLIRHKEKVMASFAEFLDEDDRPVLEQFFTDAEETVPSIFAFTVTSTDIEKTEEVRRQNMLTLTQLYTMYGERVFGLMGMLYGAQDIPPQMKELAAKFFIGATKMMDEIFKAFGEVNTREYLPLIKDLEMMVQAIEGMKMQQVRQMQGQMQGGRQGGLVQQDSVGMEPPAGPGPGAGESM